MSISLRVNGRDVQLDGPTALPDYLGMLGVDPRAVAVELNERILERAEIVAAVLDSGDVVEIVKMVGGGTGAPPAGVPPSGDEIDVAGAEVAAHKAVAPNRGLPGERLDSRHPEDASIGRGSTADSSNSRIARWPTSHSRPSKCPTPPESR